MRVAESAPGCQTLSHGTSWPEQRAPARDGAAVLDGDGGVRDVLRDAAALAEGIALRARRHTRSRRASPTIDEELEQATHRAIDARQV